MVSAVTKLSVTTLMPSLASLAKLFSGEMLLKDWYVEVGVRIGEPEILE